MATIAEIKFDIINAVRPHYNNDDLISETQVEYLIRIQRSLWMRNKIREFQYVPEIAKQTIDCIPLIDASVAECCDIDYADGCTIKRSEFKIPKLVNLIGGPAISRISSIYLNERKIIQYVARNRSAYVGLNKFNKNLLYAFMKDQYLYLVDGECKINGGLQMISFEGIFSNPLEVANLRNCDSKPCFDPMVDTYPLPEYMIPFIKEQVVAQIMQALQIPVDNTNDSTHEIKQPQR